MRCRKNTTPEAKEPKHVNIVKIVNSESKKKEVSRGKRKKEKTKIHRDTRPPRGGRLGRAAQMESQINGNNGSWTNTDDVALLPDRAPPKDEGNDANPIGRDRGFVKKTNMHKKGLPKTPDLTRARQISADARLAQKARCLFQVKCRTCQVLFNFTQGDADFLGNVFKGESVQPFKHCAVCRKLKRTDGIVHDKAYRDETLGYKVYPEPVVVPEYMTFPENLNDLSAGAYQDYLSNFERYTASFPPGITPVTTPGGSFFFGTGRRVDIELPFQEHVNVDIRPIGIRPGRFHCLGEEKDDDYISVRSEPTPQSEIDAEADAFIDFLKIQPPTIKHTDVTKRLDKVDRPKYPVEDDVSSIGSASDDDDHEHILIDGGCGLLLLNGEYYQLHSEDPLFFDPLFLRKQLAGWFSLSGRELDSKYVIVPRDRKSVV